MIKQFFETTLLKPKRLSTRPVVAISSIYYSFLKIIVAKLVIFGHFAITKYSIYYSLDQVVLLLNLQSSEFSTKPESLFYIIKGGSTAINGN